MKQLELNLEITENSKEPSLSSEGDRSRSGKEEGLNFKYSPKAVSSAVEMEEIASEINLVRALNRIKANKGSPGPDRKSVEEVEQHFKEILPKLKQTLQEGRYIPGEIRRVWIPKPCGGRRGLGIPNVIDRVVQQAIHQVLSPIYEPKFHERSYGFRPGRSCGDAVHVSKRLLDEGFEWVVDLDLSKFFDRVNHQRLMSRIGQEIKDWRVLKLIHRYLKSRVVLPNGLSEAVMEGTPQGGPLSPLLSNIVLDELDQELSSRGHEFVRYADDCNIYVRSERAGCRVKSSITRFIEKKLRLKVNELKSSVCTPEACNFLGFTLRRSIEQEEILIDLSSRSRKRIETKIRELTPRNWGNSLKKCICLLNQYLRGWMGYFQTCTEHSLYTLKTFESHIRRRLRAIQLKQWKRKRTIARKLIQLGVKPKTAWRGVYKGKQSFWALSHCPAVDRGLRNVYFTERGLVSLQELWRKLNPKPITASTPVQSQQLELALN